MTRSLVASVVAVCSLTVQVQAQSSLPIAVDQRVRVWTSSPAAIVGRVSSINAGGFEVTEEGRVPVGVANASVQRLEVSRGGKSKGSGAAKGALWGAIIGGAAGAVLSAVQHDQIGEDGSSVGEAAALGAWSGGLFGGLIGAGIGAARAGEKWEEVYKR